MENTAKIKSFIKQFVAAVQGDSAEATAQRVYRQVDSALSTQLNNLKGDLIDKESALLDAQEALKSARINKGIEILGGNSERSAYVHRLFEAKNAVTKAEEELDKHKAKISFIEEELKALQSED